MQLLRKILFPFSLLYALVVYFRNLFYDWGWFASHTFQTPTICVGNLSVGGTGKTPMIEWLVRNLGKNYQLAVLSRGYRRKSKGFIKASEESSAETLGDEPFQIFRKFNEIQVAVDADRSNGIMKLEKSIAPDIILLDDAYQHRKVRCSYYLLLTSYDKLFKDDWYLPTGNLRDHKNQSLRAHSIVVTKCPETLSALERQRISTYLSAGEKQQVFFSYLRYSKKLNGSFGEVNFDFLKDKEFILVTGIANPKPLVQFLKGKDLNFQHLSFKDHHHFSDNELSGFEKHEYILTTEKDYVRLMGNLNNLLYVAVEHQFFDGEEKLLASIKNVI